jgi:thiamine kinase-like enzyme
MFPETMSSRSLAVSRAEVSGITSSLYIVSGITNEIRKVTPEGGSSAMLVRCYGAAGMIDRDIETATFEALAEWLGRPGYLGRFANGRVEEWLDGYRVLTLHELSSPQFAPSIARAMARLHNFKLPPRLKPHLRVARNHFGKLVVSG